MPELLLELELLELEELLLELEEDELEELLLDELLLDEELELLEVVDPLPPPVALQPSMLAVELSPLPWKPKLVELPGAMLAFQLRLDAV